MEPNPPHVLLVTSWRPPCRCGAAQAVARTSGCVCGRRAGCGMLPCRVWWDGTTQPKRNSAFVRPLLIGARESACWSSPKPGHGACVAFVFPGILEYVVPVLSPTWYSVVARLQRDRFLL